MQRSRTSISPSTREARRTSGTTALAIGLVAILVAACGSAATPVPTPAPTVAPTTVQSAAATATPRPTPAPPELTTVTVPQFAVSPLMLPTWIAIDEGLFTKQGITVEIPNVPSSQMLAGYLSGTFAFGAIGGYNPPNILAAGRKVEMYGNNYAYHLYDFFVQPETNALTELVGKTVAITGLGGAPHAASLTLLKNAGVDTSQVTFLRTGGLNEILAALTTKQVQGGAFGPPQSVNALKAGLKRIARMGPMRLPYPTVIIAGDPDWVNANPNTAKAYLRGFIEGVAILISDKATANKVLAARMNLDATNTELMDASYAYAADNITRPREMKNVTDANLQSVAETYVGDGTFDITKAKMTRDIIGELEQEGFFDELDAKYTITNP